MLCRWTSLVARSMHVQASSRASGPCRGLADCEYCARLHTRSATGTAPQFTCSASEPALLLRLERGRILAQAGDELQMHKNSPATGWIVEHQY